MSNQSPKQEASDSTQPASASSTQESDSNSAPAPNRRPRRRFGRGLLRFFLMLVIPAIAVMAGAYYYINGGRYVTTENAYVKANIVAISADVSGRVIWVGVNDNEHVNSEQVLFHIDPSPFEVKVNEFDAELDNVSTEIESLRVDYEETLALAEQARERVAFLERQLDRQRGLRKRGMGREEDYDSAEFDLSNAVRRVSIIETQANRVLARLAGNPRIPAEAHPRYRKALAVRDEANMKLEDAVIRAPASGIVSNMKLQVGEYVEEGEAIFSLIEDRKVWVEANLKETQLTYVTEEQLATIILDAYPDHTFEAKVHRIAPATGAEFSLLPPQNATGNWVKVVQRVPVQLQIASVDDEMPSLRAGMTASISIDTERERELPPMVQKYYDQIVGQVTSLVQATGLDKIVFSDGLSAHASASSQAPVSDAKN